MPLRILVPTVTLTEMFSRIADTARDLSARLLLLEQVTFRVAAAEAMVAVVAGSFQFLTYPVNYRCDMKLY